MATDVDGFNTNTETHNLNVAPGSQEIFSFKHSTDPLSIATTELKINYLRYQANTFKIYGELKMPDDVLVSCADNFKFTIGSQTDYSQTVLLNLFKKKSFQNIIFYEYENADYKITLSEGGMFWVNLKNLDIETINQANRGKVTIELSDQIGRKTLRFSCNNNICYGE